MEKAIEKADLPLNTEVKWDINSYKVYLYRFGLIGFLIRWGKPVIEVDQTWANYPEKGYNITVNDERFLKAAEAIAEDVGEDEIVINY
jgi:hypothetical protein